MIEILLVRRIVLGFVDSVTCIRQTKNWNWHRHIETGFYPFLNSLTYQKQSISIKIYVKITSLLSNISGRGTTSTNPMQIYMDVGVALMYFKYPALREKCPNTGFFLVHILPNSVRIRENMDQKKLRIWTLFSQCCNLKKIQYKYNGVN